MLIKLRLYAKLHPIVRSISFNEADLFRQQQSGQQRGGVKLILSPSHWQTAARDSRAELCLCCWLAPPSVAARGLLVDSSCAFVSKRVPLRLTRAFSASFSAADRAGALYGSNGHTQTAITSPHPYDSANRPNVSNYGADIRPHKADVSAVRSGAHAGAVG